MTHDTYANIYEALAEAFPGIEFSAQPYGGVTISLHWTDGPTPSQVAAIAEPLATPTFLYLDRTLSTGFRSLLEDDFEHFLGEPYERDRRYTATFIDGRIVRSTTSITSGDVLLRRLAQVTSVDAERCVWQVPA